MVLMRAAAIAVAFLFSCEQGAFGIMRPPFRICGFARVPSFRRRLLSCCLRAGAARSLRLCNFPDEAPFADILGHLRRLVAFERIKLMAYRAHEEAGF